ncbi:AraC family transcriptional regulator [Tissierella carlieri]|jgi:AraC-like DNA-binding protein|uniref:helix-turn-helix domain-containing protein n=1 Tax=Tissierella carlieri TaxID=689904 RepID=UPI001C0F73FC|nr:helix-turn-helix domain-containing protein [Tissierella carlieri]MBU5312330.1 AraC family transcriptional regulator [Tissierella carlieri]
MNFKKLLTNNKLLVRLIISYLITSILLTSILMAVVSYFVSSRTKAKTNESQRDLMRQSYNTAYYALTNIYGDFYVLWSRDEDIRRTLQGADIYEEDIKIASKIIDNAAFKDDLVDSVYIINKKANLIISNIYPPQSIETFYDKSSVELFNDFEKHYNSYKNEVFFPRKTSYSIYGTKYNKDYISIVYAANNEDGKLDSGIIVNIDQNKLSSLLNTANRKEIMLIANSGGKIISGSQGTGFAKPLPRSDIYRSIANNPNDEDGFTGEYLGEKSFITFKKAENIGFVFISIVPYSLIKAETTQINRVIALFFIIAMFISLLVSIFSAKRIYEPLDKLIKNMRKDPSIDNVVGVDEYTFLGEAYNSLILKNVRSHVSRIFNGNYNDSAEKILGFSKEKFLTLAIIADDSNSSLDLLEKVLDIMEINVKWVAAITSSNSISCIINEDDFDDGKMENIMEELVNLQGLIVEDLDITVSIGIGTVVNSLDSIKFSHRYAILAVQYAMSIGENQVILYNEIENSKVAASVNKDSIADKIDEYVLNNFTRQDFSVDEIAEEVNLSLGYIRQIFRSEKGVTLNDYIISCRIDKAKELLINTDNTAKDISEAVGYYDNRYFYTLFKKKVGMTTEEFRKLRKEELSN